MSKNLAGLYECMKRKINIFIVILFVFLLLVASLYAFYFHCAGSGKNSSLCMLFSSKFNFNEVYQADTSQETIFSSLERSYTLDPDLGAVGGESRTSSTSVEFREWMDKGWSEGKESTMADDVMNEYTAFFVTEVNDHSVGVKEVKSNEVRDLEIGCLPENSALFKNTFYLYFVASNIEIRDELKTGDWLYTKCPPEDCLSTSSECIIVRVVKD